MRLLASDPGEKLATIVVVVDDATSAESLLGWALQEAGHRHSRLGVVYAPGLRDARGGLTPDDADFLRGRRELAVALERLHAADHVDVDLMETEPCIDAIRETALMVPDGLIVAGPLGRATLAELVFGSSARRGGRVDSGIPVVVVPSRCWPPCRGLSDRPALTVGFHGSIPAVAALRWAVREADRRDALVRAVLVWCEGEYGCAGGSVAIGHTRQGRSGHAASQLASDCIVETGVPIERVTVVARRGTPTGILVAEAEGSDLLVVGAGQSVVHGYPVLGVTTLGCVGRSPVPVVIVPNLAA